MNSSKATLAMACFVFGLAVGAFAAVTVVREAVPLRDHAWMIGIALLTGIPICALLFVWYRALLRSIRTVLGEKGGGIISSIMTFQLVTIVILFLLIVSILYAAIV